MTTYSNTLTLLACLLLAGCASVLTGTSETVPPQSQYDSIIADDNGSLLSINELAKALAPADVIVIGEYHGHHGSHLLQALVQSALYQQRPQQVLSMEQFNVDDQQRLDEYLDGKSGEEELIADTEAWPNYKASYRPLIELSKSRNVPVIAANAPADIVRCVGRTGAAHLDELEAGQRRQLPEDPFVDTPEYRSKFFDTLGGGHGSNHNQADVKERLENSYQAQLLRDNTMADRVIKALEDHPGHQVIHLTGTFHAEDRLGMVAVLEEKQPDLEVAVVSPVFWKPGDDLDNLLETHRGKGDFLYFLQPLPEEYRDSDRHRDAIMDQFRNAAELSCE